MGLPAHKLETEVDGHSETSVKNKLLNTYTDELVFGICTHIGSQRDTVIEALRSILSEKYDYKVHIIKLSSFINEYITKSEIELTELQGKTKGYAALMQKIEYGDIIRIKTQSNSILAELAIKQIRLDRELYSRDQMNKNGQTIKDDEKFIDENMQSRRCCYIIDSLKNKEELEVLRLIYRDIFYAFSIYTPTEERKYNLIHKTNGLSEEEAISIIHTDEYEDIGEHGQNVRDTFIDADFFIRSTESNTGSTINDIQRYLDIIFNTAIITPTNDEIAMYFAKSASGNSACLSRQVGATITDSNGVVIAQGWNDVPCFGGNLYRGDDENSNKCFKLNKCMNVVHRNEIFEEIMSRIRENINGVLNDSSLINEDQSENILSDIDRVIRDSKFKSIIEYSRSIHAEMHAIIIGSQLTGNKMIGGNLFCTTYPCHNCARHIVLAGIKNIYYIEPYKKSLCITLHSDSITENESDSSKVRILMYNGVAPRRYLEFFTMIDNSRKNSDGTLKNIPPVRAVPKNRLSLQSLPTLENQAVHALSQYDLPF